MKKFVSISIIVILGLVLRLIFINKPDGLWNDEYVSWMIAATPFGNNFIQAVKSQCHMPFYYLYLKFFMTIFGQSDLLLRLTSVFAGILSIIAMYFTGKEKDEKTGLYCAGFTAISSFLIYYSQEVRLYQILFLFSVLSLLYTIKCIKKPNKLNFSLFALFNFLILFTHTIGFVFVFFNLIFLSINLYKQFKKLIIAVWISIFTGGIILIPLTFTIFTGKAFVQWWGNFSLVKIAFLFSDYFSPILTNLTNSPDNFFYAPKLAFFMILPTLIAVFFICKSLIKNKFNTGLFLICTATVLVLTAAALLGKLVFITKYSIEIYPILIYLTCCGIETLNNTKIKNTLIILYSAISIGYILFAPYSAPKMHRAEGHKIPADILNQFNLQKDDIILLEYYPESRFYKYFDFSNYRTIDINKGNFGQYLKKDTTHLQSYLNGKEIYREIFKSDNNINFESIIKKDIIDNLQQGQSVVLIILNSVAFYSPDQMQEIAGNDKLYNETPLLFMVFSYVKYKTFTELSKSLTVTNLAKKGNWILVKFTKLNNDT